MAFVFGLQTLWLKDNSKIYHLKGLKHKKGHLNFYECCDLTKKVYLRLWYKVSLEEVKELSTVCCSLCFRACGSIYWCHLHSMQKNIYFSWNHFREIFVKLISRKKHEKIIMIFGKINLVNSVTDFFHYFVWFLPIM